MEPDLPYYYRIADYLNESIGKRFNLNQAIEGGYWQDDFSKFHKIETIPIENMEKFLFHVKLFIDQKNEDDAQIEFSEDYSKLRVRESWSDMMLCKRFTELPLKQQGITDYSDQQKLKVLGDRNNALRDERMEELRKYQI